MYFGIADETQTDAEESLYSGFISTETNPYLNFIEFTSLIYSSKFCDIQVMQ